MSSELQQSPEDQRLLKIVRDALNLAEPYHKQWRTKANHHYALYRNYADWRESVNSTTTERGRDAVRRDGEKVFGTHLFVPWTYSVIETIVPRMLAHRPRMLILPGDPGSDRNVKNMKYMIDRQQERIDFEMIAQSICKTGLIYGLGIGKIFWEEKWKNVRRLVSSELPAGDQLSPYAQTSMQQKVVDDPTIQSVDPFDFLWDPFASELEDCEFVIHRAWRSSAYVKKMIEQKRWRYYGKPEDLQRLLEGGGSGQDTYDSVWGERNKVSGYSSSNQQNRNKHRHEVLEYHDGDQVIVTLDRHCIVAAGENPFWHGRYPFVVYRPTHLPNQFAGVGEAEPIEDLQLEINMLRSQRRDNASLVLNKVIAYMDGQVEEQHLRNFRPGLTIPVTGDPKELLFPINIGEIPHSSYQEEGALKEDFDRTSGISDETRGSLTPGSTATGVQLVQAAAGERIKNKARRFEREAVRQSAAQFGELNQQMILTRKDVRIPSIPTMGEPDRRWTWVQLGPEELAGNFAYEVEGGSMEPEDKPMRAQEAQALWTLFGNNPNVDQQLILVECLERLGLKQPERFLRPPEPKVPPETLDLVVENLVKAGAPPDQAKALVADALQQGLQGEADAQASQNGGTPPAPVPA